MLQLEQAQARLLDLVKPLDTESVPLEMALGRIAANAVSAPIDLPPFDNSAVDGYAVRSADVTQTSENSPTGLHLVGRVPAGQQLPGQMGPGQCVRVMTGSPLPAGADSVIMQEDVQLDPATPQTPAMLAPSKPWENVRFQGEDVKRGTHIVEAGVRLRIPQLGLLAALGCASVLVHRRPRLGLIATGSELRESTGPLGPAQIYESNRAALAPLAAKAGAIPIVYPLVPDDLSATELALRRAFAECDAVLTSGGVSVGELDFVKLALERLGGEVAFWRVAIKPGKPFVLGTKNGKLLFGLPGNPVSAFVTFLVLVWPALLKFQGATCPDGPRQGGILSEPMANHDGRRHFMRVILDRNGQVRGAGPQASHRWHSLASANGVIDVPPQTVLQPGTRVSVLVWE